MKVIGATTKYLGHGIPGAHGRDMVIATVLHNRLLPYTEEDRDELIITDDAMLEWVGGVTEHDRVETYIMKPNGTVLRFYPRAVDLEMFVELKKP